MGSNKIDEAIVDDNGSLANIDESVEEDTVEESEAVSTSLNVEDGVGRTRSPSKGRSPEKHRSSPKSCSSARSKKTPDKTATIVSLGKGLDSGRRSQRVESLWRPISDKLEFRHHPNVRSRCF